MYFPERHRVVHVCTFSTQKPPKAAQPDEKQRLHKDDIDSRRGGDCGMAAFGTYLESIDSYLLTDGLAVHTFH